MSTRRQHVDGPLFRQLWYSRTRNFRIYNLYIISHQVFSQLLNSKFDYEIVKLCFLDAFHELGGDFNGGVLVFQEVNVKQNFFWAIAFLNYYHNGRLDCLWSQSFYSCCNQTAATKLLQTMIQKVSNSSYGCSTELIGVKLGGYAIPALPRLQHSRMASARSIVVCCDCGPLS